MTLNSYFLQLLNAKIMVCGSLASIRKLTGTKAVEITNHYMIGMKAHHMLDTASVVKKAVKKFLKKLEILF